jgi:hypothetical protein
MTSSTVTPSRTSAPAAVASSTSSASMRDRRGATRNSAGAVLDQTFGLSRGTSEGHRPHRRRTLGGQPVEQAPSGQLDNTVARQSVRGQGVAGDDSAVEQEDVVTLRSEEPCGRRAGAPGTDDDHVVLRAKALLAHDDNRGAALPCEPHSGEESAWRCGDGDGACRMDP